jgi:hypothetical protein
MYEAAVLALKAFREHDCEPGLAAWLEVEVRAPGVKHTTTPASVRGVAGPVGEKSRRAGGTAAAARFFAGVISFLLAGL